MQVTIRGILYETAELYSDGVRVPILIPVSEKSLHELAKDGKILVTPVTTKEIKHV